MTFSELVDETVEYYTTNPRSLDTNRNNCVYAGPNGERCAAARLCDESASDFEKMDNNEVSEWRHVTHLATLKPEYAHFTVEQIGFLQRLHDLRRNWLKPNGEGGTGGLSRSGFLYVEFIKKTTEQ